MIAKVRVTFDRKGNKLSEEVIEIIDKDMDYSDLIPLLAKGFLEWSKNKSTKEEE